MPDKIGVALRHRLQSAQDYDTFDVNIFVTGEPAGERLAEAYAPEDAPAAEDFDPKAMIKQIQDDCAANNKDLIGFLEGCRAEADFIDDEVSVLYGRCLHRGALMADGEAHGDDIVCGVHGWDYQFRSGVSSYNSKEVLHRFGAWVEEGGVWVDED